MSGKKGVDFLKAIAQYMTKDGTGFDRVLNKVKVVSIGDGKCNAEFTVEEDHLNRGGGLHGGFIATAVDIVTTLALMSNERNPPPGVSTDIHVTYINGAKQGDNVSIEASTVKAGKNLAYLECFLKEKNSGKILAKGLHTKFVG